jgi:hypothetical protein
LATEHVWRAILYQDLNFNPKTKIKDGLRGASKGYLPISMEKLKEENGQLYDLVLDRIRE